MTYGGVAMTEVAASPNAHGTGETSVVHCYFLGANIPTGAQTVTATVSGTTTKRGYSVTLTAAKNTEVVDSDATINSDSLANPNASLATGGRSCFAAIAFQSGQNAVTGITPSTGWTARDETDFGTQTAGCYTDDTIETQSFVQCGWTQTAEDAVAIAVLISEVAATAYELPGGAGPGSFSLAGVAASFYRTYVLAGPVGTYAVTGSPTTFAKDRPMDAAPGSYAFPLGLPETALIADHLLKANDGVVPVFLVEGQPASALVGYAVAADPGPYILVGLLADLTKTTAGYTIAADPSSFGAAGADVAFLVGYALTAEVSVHIVTGAEATVELSGRHSGRPWYPLWDPWRYAARERRRRGRR